MSSVEAGEDGERLQAGAAFEQRRGALQRRVNEAAKALLERGIRPTVARVRAALGGGSPNDLAPAVKHWREVVLPGLPSGLVGSGGSAPPALPLQVADLVHELWQRAMAAALVEVRGGPTAREVAARSGEAHQLRQQMVGLRDQLQRESVAFGELRAQAARHAAIAREAVARAHEGEERERELLRELGGLRQRVAELEAVVRRRAVRGRNGASAKKKRGARGKKRGARAKKTTGPEVRWKRRDLDGRRLRARGRVRRISGR